MPSGDKRDVLSRLVAQSEVHAPFVTLYLSPVQPWHDRCLSRGEMQKLWHSIVSLRIWSDHHGQDLIDYAMIAGFIAVVSGMFLPNVSQDVSRVYSELSRMLLTRRRIACADAGGGRLRASGAACGISLQTLR